MIAAVIFVLAFLVLGLGVLVFAFSGRAAVRYRRERRRARAAGSWRSWSRSWSSPSGLRCRWPSDWSTSNDHAKSAPGGVDLNASQAAGRAVFAKYCATCHTLKASNAVGKVGPNLDVLHPPKGLILDAIAKGRARGQGQMPAGLVDGEDAQDVAAYVAAVAGRG